ncbi:ImmA/IrrE family metallo-endopeptidase [Pelagicoccus mobilis]|uniref:ImmA/IrrE family metallo-endopeptidase n=2 Tax=Pelagicoccus mobilis TaxID=415221 RepID=A0A934VTQ7_9BACT|nr:ImmA/IrrE family metallo-endopeptidase [Pelagicoccus mobilis]
MKTKLIKTKEEHAQAIERLSSLMDANPTSDSPEEDELELLAFLIESYEKDHFDRELPDPIEAIKFRMEQQGLSPNDLIPFLGSKSKVSEVLNRKRPLSVSMMRRLSTELGIPGDILLGKAEPLATEAIPVEEYPLKEIYNRWYKPKGLFKDLREFKKNASAVLDDLFQGAGEVQAIPALLRQRNDKRKVYDEFALHAWKAQVLRQAAEQVESLPPYLPSLVDASFAKQLALLSSQKEGPRLAVDALRDRGIAVVFEDSLPRTYLDGAALNGPAGRPVIALTIRYNRLDNFWFCLFHELAHVHLHLKQDGDKIDVELDKESHQPKEEEADRFALEAFIPETEWPEILLRCTDLASVRQESKRRMIHPSVIAGRIRKDTGNYRLFNPVMGHGEVRELLGLE